MDNSDNRFENITMNGRMCYIFMCIERYLLALYPERDWSPAARRMWQWTSYHCWTDDDGLYTYEEIIPEILFEFEGYEATSLNEFDGIMSRESYDELTSMYDGITDGNEEDEINRLLLIPISLWRSCDCEYYDIEEGRKETEKYIGKTEAILNAHNIPLPDVSLLSSFTPENTDPERARFGYYNVWRTDHAEWGFGVDSEYLSIILNKTER